MLDLVVTLYTFVVQQITGVMTWYDAIWQQVNGFLSGAYGTYGYPLVLIAALIENTAVLSIFLPGGTVVVLGGAYARSGELSLPLVILAGTIGTIIGSTLDFVLGRLGRRGLLGPFGRSARVRELLVAAEHFYDTHGPRAILGAHFIGLARAIAAVGAGVSDMPYYRFLFYESIAALLWNGLYSGMGYLIGVSPLNFATSLVIGLAMAYLLPRLVPARSGGLHPGQSASMTDGLLDLSRILLPRPLAPRPTTPSADREPASGA